MKKNFDLADLEKEDFFSIGTLTVIESVEHFGGELKLAIRGIERIRLHNIIKKDKLLFASVEILETLEDLNEENSRTLANHLKELATEIASYFEGTEDAVKQLSSLNSPLGLIYSIAPYLSMSRAEKQELLEEPSLKELGMKVLDHMVKQKESIKLQAEMANKMTEKASRSYRENVLREQLKVIQNELHEKGHEEEGSLKDRVEKSVMPDEVRKTAIKELGETGGSASGKPGNPDYKKLSGSDSGSPLGSRGYGRD